MISPLAWLRALTFVTLILLSCSYTSAHEDTIFTSSVTYCTPPETLLITRFDVAYFAANRSVSFNVSAASVQANVNVTANILLNVYGMKPVNMTINLCTILKGALCPLPMYNFTGADSIPLPASIGIADLIPSIAFKIPDLEGFAQLTLTEVNTGIVRACVQTTLANGWSARQPAVSWVTGGIALASLASAAWQSVSPLSIAPTRFLELVYLYQSVAASGLLDLNYPSVYRAYTLNFVWALGLFGGRGGLQGAINRMRHATGGTLPDAGAGSAIGLVNRKQSPYNTNTRRALAKVGKVLSAIENGDVQTVTGQSGNVLEAGVPISVNLLGIATANAFMTVFFTVLFMFVVAAAISGIVYVIVRKVKGDFDFVSFVRAWSVRLALIALFPVGIFAFYQWTLKDSWLSVLISVFTLLSILGLLGWASFLTLRLARSQSPDSLYTPSAHLSSFHPLYTAFRPARYFHFLPLLVATLLKSIAISFVHSSGTAQLAILIATEAALVAATLFFRPHTTRRARIFSLFIGFVRLACTGLLIAFLQSLNVKPIPRVVIGIVVAIIYSVSLIVMFINLIVNTGVFAYTREKLFRRTRRTNPIARGGGSLTSSKEALDVLEKGEKSTSVPSRKGSVEGEDDDVSSWDQIVRPGNPSPPTTDAHHHLTPFPISPATTVSTMDPPSSLYTDDHGLSSLGHEHEHDDDATTYGSLLPRRWSFSLSQPGSPGMTASYPGTPGLMASASQPSTPGLMGSQPGTPSGSSSAPHSGTGSSFSVGGSSSLHASAGHGSANHLRESRVPSAAFDAVQEEEDEDVPESTVRVQPVPVVSSTLPPQTSSLSQTQTVRNSSSSDEYVSHLHRTA